MSTPRNSRQEVSALVVKQTRALKAKALEKQCATRAGRERGRARGEGGAEKREPA
jgi:hypothetical protein